ncbi:hypothetical protein G6F46_015736 [Rhizopus delemar]|nr:hypothetical protein G6F46_015736 [Rhizopus delemar]
MQSSSASASARSRMFSSSRTLPGKAYWASASSAAGASSGVARPWLRASRASTAAASSGRSWRRSRSGGTFSSITLMR